MWSFASHSQLVGLQALSFVKANAGGSCCAGPDAIRQVALAASFPGSSAGRRRCRTHGPRQNGRSASAAMKPAAMHAGRRRASRPGSSARRVAMEAQQHCGSRPWARLRGSPSRDPERPDSRSRRRQTARQAQARWSRLQGRLPQLTALACACVMSQRSEVRPRQPYCDGDGGGDCA